MKYTFAIKNGNFTEAVSNYHHYTLKNGLKFNVSNLGNEYKIQVLNGSETLFKLEVYAKNKQIAKNMASLKYMELYLFGSFKELYLDFTGEEGLEG